MGKLSKLNKINFKEMTGIVPISKGGTGKGNIPEFADSLNGIKFNQRNAANGVAGLNIHTKLDKELFDIKSISINGNDTIQVNSVATYNIVNYSSFNEYDISVSSGSFTVTDGIISYTAPSQPETVIMTVNGRDFVLNIVPIVAYVVKPNVVTPVNGSLNLGPNISFTSSAFEASGGVDTHESSDWQIATDANFSNIVASVTDDVINKTSWNVSNLVTNTGFYVRVRYKGTNMGYSNWSVANSFTTKTSYVANNEEAVLMASDKASNDRFGNTVAINKLGDRILVGAYTEDPGNTTDAGSVYIFVKTNGVWTQEAKIWASDKATNDAFSSSLGINDDGSRAIIGSYFDGSGVGSAYIFTRSGTTWTQEAKLTASDPATGDYFGWSVSIDGNGDRVAIGAYGEDPGGVNFDAAGSVYIFTRSGTTWTQEAKINASDKTPSAHFGYSVFINTNGDRIAIGAIGAGVPNIPGGAVYIFSRSGTVWTQEAKLTASDINNDLKFGCSVFMDSNSDRIIIGGYGGSGSLHGAAYIFTRSGTTWTQEARLINQNIVYAQRFGEFVSINASGDQVVIGAFYGDQSGISQVGAAYIFTRSGSTWTEEAELIPDNKSAGMWYGRSVSIDGNAETVVIGAQGFTIDTYYRYGAAYVYN